MNMKQHIALMATLERIQAILRLLSWSTVIQWGIIVYLLFGTS